MDNKHWSKEQFAEVSALLVVIERLGWGTRTYAVEKFLDGPVEVRLTLLLPKNLSKADATAQ